MKKETIQKTAWTSAIIVLLSYVLYSTVQLVGFAANEGAISRNTSPIISTIITNYTNFNLYPLILILIGNIIIYLTFIRWAKTNQKLITIALSILLVASAIFTLKLISLIFSSFPIPLSINAVKAIISISYLFLGIVILVKKHSSSNILLSLSIFYILQGIFVFTSIKTLVQLVDLTVAIKIAEAIFFYNLYSEKN